MTDPADTRFFEALRDACQLCDGVDPGFRDTVTKALVTGDPLDLMAARKALDGLENSVKDQLLRQVHLRMATDLSAIWDAMPGSPTGRRPN